MVVSGCQGLQLVEVRRHWEAGGRGKERVNLSKLIGNSGTRLILGSPSEKGPADLGRWRETAAPYGECVRSSS